MTKKIWKELGLALIFLLLAALLLGVAGRALRPVRVDYGAVWGPYLAEELDSLDYLYLGSSYAYCDVNPGVVYDASGLAGHVLAGPEQTLSITYYYLREALKTQRPSAVLLEGSALHFAKYQDYSQVNVGYMPYNLNRVAAALTAAEPELRTGLLFDLYFYHARWRDVTLDEVRRALAPPQTDHLRGFTAAEGVFEDMAGGPFRRAEQEESVYRENLAWLEKIQQLCRGEGIPLVLVLHPTYSRFSQETYGRIAADAQAMGIACYDWSALVEELGLDPLAHFYDPGHLNQDGAEIFSRWLGGFLTGELGLAPRPQTEKNAASWMETAS